MEWRGKFLNKNDYEENDIDFHVDISI